NYGPAVIGTTDNLDGRDNALKVDLALTNLDLETPPPTSPGTWEEAPRLMRLATAESGRIAGNILRGGMVDFARGPWIGEKNDYRGTALWTYSFSVFSCSYTHDLVLRDNTARPVGASGKTWRFLVMTQGGIGDTVRDNKVEGIGPRDGDAIPDKNAPEIV